MLNQCNCQYFMFISGLEITENQRANFQISEKQIMKGRNYQNRSLK